MISKRHLKRLVKKEKEQIFNNLNYQELCAQSSGNMDAIFEEQEMLAENSEIHNLVETNRSLTLSEKLKECLC